MWQVCKNTSIHARNSIHVPVRESHPSKKESPVLVYKLTARTEEKILNPIIWNVFDELRMCTFVMDRNNLVFKHNLEIVFVPYMTCMKLFMEIDNFRKLVEVTFLIHNSCWSKFWRFFFWWHLSVYSKSVFFLSSQIVSEYSYSHSMSVWTMTCCFLLWRIV